MSDKKPGITMNDVKVVTAPAVPKVRKPGITTNQVNVPAPAPRAEGIVRGPIISTNDLPLKVAPVPPAVNWASLTEPVKVTPDQFKKTPDTDNDEIPDRDWDDMSKIEPAPAPKAKRKPAARKHKV